MTLKEQVLYLLEKVERSNMKDVKVEVVLPNRDEDKDDIAYIISRILEKSGIDNFIGETSYEE